MSVYNGAKYLPEAIESILGQSFADFEFIIINDGSFDESLKIIKSYEDQRIVVINNEFNLGLIKCLNKGIEIAKGEFIARMDADDVSLPGRLEKQVHFLDQNPDISFCGSQTTNNESYPLTHDCIRVTAMAYNPFAHPTMIWRKADFIMNNLYYNELYPHAEDYELWSRAMMKLKSANLPESLLFYRVHDDQIGRKYIHEQTANSRYIQLSILNSFGINADEDQLKIHFCIFGDGLRTHRKLKDLENAENWLKYLLKINENKNIFNNNCLINLWAKKIYSHGLYYNSIPIWIWSRRSLTRNASNISIKEKIRFFVKCIIIKTNK